MYNFLCKIIFFSLLYICLTIKKISSQQSFFLGILYSIFFKKFFIPKNISNITNLLLKIFSLGIMFGIDYKNLLYIFKYNAYYIIIIVFLIFYFGLFINKYLKINNNISILITSGTAICGGSAISVIASIIKANSKEIGISLISIFIFNSLSFFFIPKLALIYNINAENFGILSSLTMYDLGSVIASSIKYNKNSLSTAIYFKLFRVLCIIPLSYFINFFMINKNIFSKKIDISLLILLISPLLKSLFSKYLYIFEKIYFFSNYICSLVFFLLGVNININSIKNLNLFIIIQSFLLWIFLCFISFVFIYIKAFL